MPAIQVWVSLTTRTPGSVSRKVPAGVPSVTQSRNSTPYGLASGIQTTNLTRAHRVADRLQAGIVWVNDWPMLDPAVPFGGVKASGFGREYGPEALESYTKVKSVVVSLD